MISVRTDRGEYAPGSAVEFEVGISFDKPLKARSLSARLVCEEKRIVKTTRVKDHYDAERERELGVPGATNIITSTHEEGKTLFEQERELSGEREYRAGEVFRGKFVLPPNAPATSHEFGHDNKIHVWTLSIKLDIPFALDRHAEKEIFVAGLG